MREGAGGFLLQSFPRKPMCGFVCELYQWSENANILCGPLVTWICWRRAQFVPLSPPKLRSWWVLQVPFWYMEENEANSRHLCRKLSGRNHKRRFWALCRRSPGSKLCLSDLLDTTSICLLKKCYQQKPRCSWPWEAPLQGGKSFRRTLLCGAGPW